MLGDVNISAILDSFSVSYDKRVRPNYGGMYEPAHFPINYISRPRTCLGQRKMKDEDDEEEVFPRINQREGKRKLQMKLFPLNRKSSFSSSPRFSTQREKNPLRVFSPFISPFSNWLIGLMFSQKSEKIVGEFANSREHFFRSGWDTRMGVGI